MSRRASTRVAWFRVSIWLPPNPRLLLPGRSHGGSRATIYYCRTRGWRRTPRSRSAGRQVASLGNPAMHTAFPATLAATALVAFLSRLTVAGFPAGQVAAIDSVVLERTACRGTCPTYELRIARTGQITFVSHSPGDPTRASARLPQPAVDSLLAEVNHARFFEFPARIVDDPALCSHRSADLPTAIITLYRRGNARRVEDDLGCRSGLEPSLARRLGDLRRLEDAIDRIAGSGRWVRPDGFKR